MENEDLHVELRRDGKYYVYATSKAIAKAPEDIRPGDITAKGKPYTSLDHANKVLRKKGLTDTHSVIRVRDGWVGRLSPAKQEVSHETSARALLPAEPTATEDQKLVMTMYEDMGRETPKEDVESPIMKIRKNGGIDPRDPNAEDLRVSLGWEKGGHGGFFRKGGMTLDKARELVDPRPGDETTLHTINDFIAHLEDSYSRGGGSVGAAKASFTKMQLEEIDHNYNEFSKQVAEVKGVPADSLSEIEVAKEWDIYKKDPENYGFTQVEGVPFSLKRASSESVAHMAERIRTAAKSFRPGEYPEMNIAGDVEKVAHVLAQIEKTGGTVEDYLRQRNMFSEELSGKERKMLELHAQGKLVSHLNEHVTQMRELANRQNEMLPAEKSGQETGTKTLQKKNSFYPLHEKHIQGSLGITDGPQTDLMSSKSESRKGVSAESIRADLANHPLKGGVVILQSVDEIPDAVKTAAKTQGAALDNIEGFTHGGKAYVIADNVVSLERARQVLIGHELVHLGQDKATVKRAVEFFKGAKDSEYRGMLEDVAREYGYDLGTIRGYADAVREATARYAERGETGRLWDVVKTEVRFALRKLGLKLQYTDADLRGIVASMMRNADAKIRGGLGERAIKFMVGDSFKGAEGHFGPVFTQFKGKPQEAVDHLLKVRDGEAVGALHHPEIGDIDLVWGKEGDPKKEYAGGYGLAKITSKHPEVIDNLGEIVEGAKIVGKTKNSIELQNGIYRATVRLAWDGQSKRWLMTAFEPGARAARLARESTSDILSATDNGMNLPPSQGEPKDNIPPSGEDGKPFSLKKDQTETEAFKRWFGDSKVVDENGEPLVVYHATDKLFTKVDMKKGGQGTFWVTSNKRAAEAGEVGAAGSGRIMGLYAKIENPARWEEYENLSIDEIEARGHDGVILENPDGTFDAIIFSPTQVKSATDNRGTFDPENPDIRFSLKDLRETAEDIQKTLKTIATPVKGREGDAGGFLAQTLASPEWIDHDGIQKIVQHNLERVETKHEIHYELTTDDNGESIIGKLDRMKKDKKTKVQYSILSAVTTWADEKKWNALPVDKIMERTERELRDRGAKPETIALWREMRDSYDRALWRMIAPMIELRDEIRAKAKAEGKQPVFPTFGRDGETISLDELIKQMGSLRGSYAARQRVGDYELVGKDKRWKNRTLDPKKRGIRHYIRSKGYNIQGMVKLATGHC
ncbi:MAG: hypothetical protein HQK86_07375 [Nitrospinae bacterium]|nr:hypothetical protein [Nitrospinota bacterium]